jgi:hypothetical protein
VPSLARQRWGPERARRYATLQINHAYTLLLSSQFQGFCQDLHSEAVVFITSNTTPLWAADILRLTMTLGRALDNKNPTPSAIGSDFARPGMKCWPKVPAMDACNAARQREADPMEFEVPATDVSSPAA